MLASDLAWNVDYGANSVSLFVSLSGDFTSNGPLTEPITSWWRKGLGTLYAGGLRCVAGPLRPVDHARRIIGGGT